MSLRRLIAHDLVRYEGRRRSINRLRARGLIEHAVAWLAPAQLGKIDLGLATAHSAPPLADKLMGDSDPLIMPLSEGPLRGRTVTPLHPSAPLAAKNDPKPRCESCERVCEGRRPH